MIKAIMFTIAMTLAIGPARADEVVVKTPVETMSNMATNLGNLPQDWITTQPLQLDVSFNLTFPPNSPEAEAFLENWYRSIHALSGPVRLDLLRIVAPTKYQYQVSLRFNNWREFRLYESSRGLLDYYDASWKPFVTDVEERLSVIDPVTTR